MIYSLLKPLGWARKLWKREDGNASIEFAILFPAFIFLFMSAYESGMYMMRHVMLERAVDMTVRKLRLGYTDAAGNAPTHAQLKQSICDVAGVIPDCANNLLVELAPVSQTTWGPLPPATHCVDRTGVIDPLLSMDLNHGAVGDIMIVRVCAIVDPYIPTSGLGLRLPKVSGGGYALISMSTYVNEP